MQRMKGPGSEPPAQPAGMWLAGFLIGSAIVAMAAGAMALGAGAAIQTSVNKSRRHP